jgi:hypothetical protein
MRRISASVDGTADQNAVTDLQTFHISSAQGCSKFNRIIHFVSF